MKIAVFANSDFEEASAMSPRPPFVPARRIMLPASFAACGVLVLALFVVLMGCSSFGSFPDEVANPDKNAVLCECECDPPSGPIAVPWKNFIAAGPDDATEARSTATMSPWARTRLAFDF